MIEFEEGLNSRSNASTPCSDSMIAEKECGRFSLKKNLVSPTGKKRRASALCVWSDVALGRSTVESVYSEQREHSLVSLISHLGGCSHYAAIRFGW